MQVKAVVALICALFAAAAAEPTSEPTSEPTATPTTCEPISYEALDFPGSVCLWENKRDISADYTSPTRKEVYLVDTKAEKVDEHPYWNLFPCQPSATRNCSICNASTGCLEGHQTTVADSGYFATVQTDQEYPGRAEGQKAAEYYEAFYNALERYDCGHDRDFSQAYSYWNCEDCRKAYARWVCSQALPSCNTVFNTTNITKPCIQVCHDVMIRCPISLDFRCPGSGPDYNDYFQNSQLGCEWMGISAGVRVKSFTIEILLIIMSSAVYLQMSMHTHVRL